jgi:hypothetical protein
MSKTDVQTSSILTRFWTTEHHMLLSFLSQIAGGREKERTGTYVGAFTAYLAGVFSLASWNRFFTAAILDF